MLSEYAADLATTAVLAEATHVALFTDSAATTEQANADGYARQPVAWSSSGDGEEESTSAVEFEAAGSGWSGPWYPALVTSGTYGGGELIAVAVDGNGDPAPTQATSLSDGSKLVFSIGDLTFQTT